MTKEFNLSEKIEYLPKDCWGNLGFDYLTIENMKKFIDLICTKVLTDWKGQNEFIDWLKAKAGERLK